MSRGTQASAEAAPDTARLVRALQDPRCYPHEAGPVRVIETHISYVLLTGPYAYKLKKPLRLPFLDFSTLERRKHFCDEELELNRRLAPDLYLGVVPIGGSLGEPRVGRGRAIEYAVRLRQFDPDATADRMLERGLLERETVERLAATIAEFHLAAPPSEGKHPGRLAVENVVELEHALASAGVRLSADDVEGFVRREAARLDGHFAERRIGGAVRDLHGDLHLENLVLIDGTLRAFDALEFDARLRSVDVIDEAAFVVMDFAAHASPDLAYAFLNRYLEVTGDYSGLALLPFYLLHRALVRAKVRAIKAQGDAAAAAERIAPYLALARRLMPPRRPRLILTYGLSGSGKTTVTDALVPRLPAVRLRSDLERKRLAGVEPTAHGGLGVGEGRYDAAATERTYAALRDGSGRALSAGINVIVDATFLSRARRAEFAELAERHDARVTILVCEAPQSVLRARIDARAAGGKDASEATQDVLDAQLEHAEAPQPGEGANVLRVDTSGGVDYDGLTKRLLHAP
jgi:uncharacterized protein